MSIPFFYIIEHSTTGKLYAGSKFGNDADPKNFMNSKGYKTSSNTVRNIIEEEGLESFIIRKIKIFKTPEEAYSYETRFLQKVKARTNSIFLNGHENDCALPSFGSEKYKQFMLENYGVEHPSQSKELMEKAGKSISKLKNSEEWKTNKEPGRVKKFLESMDYESSKEKEKNTKSDQRWITEVWRPAVDKRTKYVLESGISKVAGQKCSATKQSEEWKSTIGARANEKHSKTLNNKEWQNSTGVVWKENMKKTRNDPDWKEKNSIICEFCGKKCDTGNYKRWHGDKCKKTP
jgi:hypothetical protein